MRRAVQLAAAASAMLAGAAAAAAEGSEDEAVSMARASLLRRLEAADAAGVVSVRDAEDGVVGAPPPQAPAPRLRTTDDSDCLTLEALSKPKEAPSGGDVQTLDELRKSVLTKEGENRSGAELALARGYLVLGFAEEARAIAIARSGAEAAGIAGLALLVEGRPDEAGKIIDEFRFCGSLYEFIAEASAVLAGNSHQLSGKSLTTLKRLPKAIQQPIAETFAVRAIGAGDRSAIDYVAIATPAGDGARSQAGVFIDAADARADRQAARASLTSLSSTPGPLRLYALHELAKHIDADSAPSAIEAFEDNAAEAVDAGPASLPTASLGLALADRRAGRGDAIGAARALGSAHRHASTREAARARAAALLRPLLASGVADDRLAALAIVASEPELASASLAAEEFLAAAAGVADLGAPDTLARMLEPVAMAPLDKSLLLSEANARAGLWQAARRVAEPFAGETLGAATLLMIARGAGDVGAERALAEQAGPSTFADFLWRQGEFGSLHSLASHKGLEPAASEKVALAFLAARRTPPPTIVAAAPNRDGVAALFAVMPDVRTASAADIAAFTGRMAKAIGYMRESLRDE